MIIYATLLVQHQAALHGQGYMVEQSILSSCHLDTAVQCLSLLSEGNRMTEKCVRYTSSLAKTLSIICTFYISRLPCGGTDMHCQATLNITKTRLTRSIVKLTLLYMSTPFAHSTTTYHTRFPASRTTTQVICTWESLWMISLAQISVSSRH